MMSSIQAFFGPGGHAAGIDEPQAQNPQHHAGAHGFFAGAGDFGAEQPRGPQRHAGVQDAEQEAGAQQSQLGRQQQWEHQRHGQRAQVVEGQHAADYFAEFGLALVEDPHHQRDLHADHQSDDEDADIQRRAKGRGQPREHQEQDGGRHAAQQRHQQFYVDEAIQNVFVSYIF